MSIEQLLTNCYQSFDEHVRNASISVLMALCSEIAGLQLLAGVVLIIFIISLYRQSFKFSFLCTDSMLLPLALMWAGQAELMTALQRACSHEHLREAVAGLCATLLESSRVRAAVIRKGIKVRDCLLAVPLFLSPCVFPYFPLFV